MSTSTHKSSELTATSRSSLAVVGTAQMSRILLVVFALATTVVVIAAIIWMQERPMRQAQQLLEAGLKSQSLAIAEGREPDQLQIREAYHTISQYLESHPNSSRGLALQARILFHVGRPEEAIEIFERVGPDSLPEIQDFARAYASLENYTRAVPLMEQVLREDPTYSDALYEVSTCRAKLGRFKAALETAEQFAAQPGNEAKGQLLVASIQTELKNLPAATEAFRKALEADPDAQTVGIPAWQFYFLYGGILAENAKPTEALPLLEKSLEIEPHPDTYTRIGDCHLALSEPQKAAAAWRMAVNMTPGHPTALERLASHELSMGNAAEALEWLKPLEKNVASSNVAFNFQRAYALLGNTEQSEAWKEKTDRLRKGETLVELINHVLTNQPESAWGIALRSHRFAAMGEWKQAEELYSVMQLDEQSDQFMKELAVAIQQRHNDLLPKLELLPIELE